MADTGWSLNRGPGQHCGSDQNDERNADGPRMAQMFNNNYRNTLYSTDCVPLNFISIFLFCFYLSVSLVSDYCAIWSSAFCPILNTRHGLAYSIFDFFVRFNCYTIRYVLWLTNERDENADKITHTHKACEMNGQNSTRINYFRGWKYKKKKVGEKKSLLLLRYSHFFFQIQTVAYINKS